MEQIEVAYLPIWRRYLDLLRRGNFKDAELGALLRAMMEYQFEGVVPEGLPENVMIFWYFIQDDLDHARLQYETSVRNGKKGGRKKGSGKKKEPEITREDLTVGNTVTESISESNQNQYQTK